MVDVLNPDWRESDSKTFISEGAIFVPDRERQIELIVRRLLDDPNPPGLVYDLCCGQGLLTHALLQHSANVRVHALDASTAMLDATRKTCAEYLDRLVLSLFRLEAADWCDRMDRADAVVSSLAIHHLDGPGKAALFRDVYAMLKPGGVFVVADLIEPRTAVGRAMLAQQWEEEVEVRSLALRGNLSGVDRFRELEWNYYSPTEPDPLDKPSSLQEQMDWLRDARFEHIDLHWCVAGHAIFSGVKPG